MYQRAHPPWDLSQVPWESNVPCEALSPGPARLFASGGPPTHEKESGAEVHVPELIVTPTSLRTFGGILLWFCFACLRQLTQDPGTPAVHLVTVTSGGHKPDTA